MESNGEEGPKKKGNWSQQNLKTGVDMVISKKLSLRQASVKYDIPRSTLHDKIAAIKSGQEVKFTPKIGRYEKTFLPEYEQLLVKHVKDLSNRCLPLTKKEFLKLAYDLAIALKIPHRFNNEKGTAGKHFYYDFMARYPELSLRRPESTSLMRTVGFNKPQVDLFFSNLELLMTLHNFPPSNIYNCDETGVSCVQKHSKVIAPKAVRQVGKLTSAERGKNITIMFCMSANGYFIPPFFIFPRQRMNDRLMINAPAQSVGVAQPKGWMNSDFFLQWMNHFSKFSRPTKENPVLVLLDGHCSHKTLGVINFCREHHIHLMSSPPHTTHKLQPLDRTFMKPFKNAYHEQCDMWMRANAGARITDYDIAGLVNNAFRKVARLEIAVSGFKCTGIYPFDKNVFSDLDFLPADLTNIPLEESECLQPTPIVPENDEVSEPITSAIVELPANFEVQPSTSSTMTIVETIHKLSPIPDAAKKRSAARKRKCEKSAILTSSPYKNAVEEKENDRKVKEVKKEITKNLKTLKDGNKKQPKNQNKSDKSEPLSQIANRQTTCEVCLEDHDESWIQCGSCLGWVHEACADVPECSDGYVCDRCFIYTGWRKSKDPIWFSYNIFSKLEN